MLILLLFTVLTFFFFLFNHYCTMFCEFGALNTSLHLETRSLAGQLNVDLTIKVLTSSKIRTSCLNMPQKALKPVNPDCVLCKVLRNDVTLWLLDHFYSGILIYMIEAFCPLLIRLFDCLVQQMGDRACLCIRIVHYPVAKLRNRPLQLFLNICVLYALFLSLQIWNW